MVEVLLYVIPAVVTFYLLVRWNYKEKSFLDVSLAHLLGILVLSLLPLVNIFLASGLIVGLLLEPDDFGFWTDSNTVTIRTVINSVKSFRKPKMGKF